MAEPVWLQRHVIVSQAGMELTVKKVCFCIFIDNVHY